MYSFPILKQSTVPCPVLTAASWPAYGFLRRQVRWSGIPISLRIFHCTQHIFIHSSIDRYLGCFHVLATVNNAVTNIQVQRTLWYATFISFRNIQKGDGWIIGSSILPEDLKLSEGIDNICLIQSATILSRAEHNYLAYEATIKYIFKEWRNE